MIIIQNIRYRKHFKLTKHKCNSNFGKMNPLYIGPDLCIKFNINILSFHDCITYKNYINRLIL